MDLDLPDLYGRARGHCRRAAYSTIARDHSFVRLGDRAAVEWWLRVVLDHELGRLGRRAVDQQLD